MNMPSTATLREASIPPPETAEPNLTPEAAERIHAALLRLLRLAVYVAVMTMLGYRIRRRRAPAAPRPTPAAPRQTPAAPPQPRPHHRYLDRDEIVAMFEAVNAAAAPAAQAQPPEARPPEAQLPEARPAESQPARPHAESPPSSAPEPAPPPARAPAPHPPIQIHAPHTRPHAPALRRRPHPPPPAHAKNRAGTTAPPHADFVALS